MKRIVVLSDYQIPYQAGTVVNTIHNFIEDYGPDEIWIVGDWIDQPEPSRWSRGTAGEYAPTLQKSVNQSVNLLADLRDIMKKKPIHFKYWQSRHKD